MTNTPPPARPSSTVVVVREAVAAPEVLMVRRHARSSFGASYVFPGGVLDAEDSTVVGFCDGVDEASANATLDVAADGLAFYSAAIRELFEETGLLLARTQCGEWVQQDPLEDYREALNEQRQSWVEVLERTDARLACNALHYFSYWVTPRERKKRYSTRFFMAALPPRQRATHCGGELTDSCWLTAADALAAHADKSIDLPPPTLATLKSVLELGSLQAMLDWTEACRMTGVRRIRPVLLHVNGERRVVMPGDADYPKEAP